MCTKRSRTLDDEERIATGELEELRDRQTQASARPRHTSRELGDIVTREGARA